jgi:hypothetical protein
MLPCQLSSLRDTFHSIFDLPHGENPLFWVDVLCLPRNYEMKGKLLNKLNAIYGKARAVLVWDRNLLGRSKPCQEKYIEMNIRLRNGEWSWRLWTLPEAILGENLYVAFQDDCFVGMNEVVDARQRPVQTYCTSITSSGRLDIPSAHLFGTCVSNSVMESSSLLCKEPGKPSNFARRLDKKTKPLFWAAYLVWTYPNSWRSKPQLSKTLLPPEWWRLLMLWMQPLASEFLLD